MPAMNISRRQPPPPPGLRILSFIQMSLSLSLLLLSLMDQLLPTRLDVSSHDVPENCARDSERYDCAPDAEATVVFGPVVGAEELGAVDAAYVGAHYYSILGIIDGQHSANQGLGG
jgi:hypothetical protein